MLHYAPYIYDTESVVKVDGTKEKALMKRFSCEAFPSIYYVAGPNTWVYAGLRTLQEVFDHLQDR